MKIEYLTQEGIDDISINEETYREFMFDDTNERMVEYLRKKNYLMPTNIEVDEIDFYMEKDDDGKYTKSDYENVKIIHEALGNKINPANAVDTRLWAGFSIMFCWDYVHFRQEAYFQEDVETRDMLKQFVFQKYGKRRNVFVQCVSRLFWAGQLFYDYNASEDNFWAIREIIADRFASDLLLMSSYNSLINRDVCLGIMDAMIPYKEKGYEIKRETLLDSYKYVDHLGGTMLLDCFEREDVKNIVTDYLSTDIFPNTNHSLDVFS